jgi:hypothetical protein
VNPYHVLQARIEARAKLFAAGEYETLVEAVLPLARYADETGITTDIGPENVMMMTLKEFGVDGS